MKAYPGPTTGIVVLGDVDSIVSANCTHQPARRLLENGGTMDITATDGERPGFGNGESLFHFFDRTVEGRALDDDALGRRVLRVRKGGVCEHPQPERFGVLSEESVRVFCFCFDDLLTPIPPALSRECIQRVSVIRAEVFDLKRV